MNTLIISLITHDKPGIIETLANIVSQSGGSWQASNFCQLAGQFAGIVEVSIAQDNVEQLTADLAKTPFVTNIVQTSESEPQQACHIIEVTGNDRVGIVKDIASVLSQSNINVTKLTSSTEPAPNWGGNLFKAIIEIKSPSEDSLEVAKENIEALTNDLIVDINVAD